MVYVYTTGATARPTTTIPHRQSQPASKQHQHGQHKNGQSPPPKAMPTTTRTTITTPSSATTTAPPLRLIPDMTAHTGLRGAAAAYIMCFHCLGIFSILQLDWQGSSLMPLFFMMSGFSLAVVYGRQIYAYPSSSSSSSSSTAGAAAAHATIVVDETGLNPPPPLPTTTTPPVPACPKFPRRAFYQNRLARILPVYYLCSLAAIPLWVYGFEQPIVLSSFIPTVVFSFIPLSTCFSWMYWAPVMDLVGPAWFVTTIVVFWIFFPWFLVHAQKLTDQRLVVGIATCFSVQFTVLHVVFNVMIPFLGFWPAFATATMNPLSRLPVFLMGVYAGVLASRHPVSSITTKDEDGSSGKGEEGDNDDAPDSLPWPSCFLGCWPVAPSQGCCCSSSKKSGGGDGVGDGGDGNGDGGSRPRSSCFKSLLPPAPTTQRGWAHLATTQSLVLFIITLLAGTIDTVLRLALKSPSGLSGGAYWLQACVAMTQLNILVALTRDGGQSLASRALRTPLAQWLGKLSMNIYLSHTLVIRYFVFLVLQKGKPNPVDCRGLAADVTPEERGACVESYYIYQLLPAWGIFVVVPVTLLMSEALYRFVEEPGRKLLKTKG